LSTQINRLKYIACATETDEHDMMRLKNSVLIAVENNASDDVIAEADSLFKRLEVELGDITLHDFVFYQSHMIIDMIILTSIITVIYCFLLSISYAFVQPNTNMTCVSSLIEVTKVTLR
jgi:hypothetical protein